MRRSILGFAGSVLSVAGMMSATPALAKIKVARNGNQVVYDISVDGVEFEPINIGGKNFVVAKLKGADRFAAVKYELGKPEVPVLRMMVEGDVQVETSPVKAMSITPLKDPIKPSQPSWDKSMKFMPPVAYDAAAYSMNAFTSAPDFEVAYAGSVRGVKRHLVTLNAMSYNAATGNYQLKSGYKVTVTKAPRRDEGQPTMALVVGAQFEQSPSLAQFIQMKQEQGYRIRQLTVGQNGLTTDVAIRDALKAIYAEGVNLRYATIIGDAADVPSHTSNTINGVTDHFYRAIDTADYTTDINGPDIGVGRLSVNTEAQLATVVNKIARYTNGQFSEDQWMQHPAFVTTHDRYEVAEGTHNTVIAKHFAPRGYDRVFPDANEKGGDKLYPVTLRATPAQIVDHMKQGRFIINYSGHGSHTGWEDVTTADVNSLDDPNALPWVISNACITGDFRQEPVFAETWLRQPNGAIVFWGSMDSSYWDEDDILEKAMYDAVFDVGKRSFDSIHQYALGDVWRYYGGANRSTYYWETYVTFGDPSLEVRTAKAKEANIEGPDAIVVGTDVASWKVSTDQGPAKLARVLLRRSSDGVAVSGITNDVGEATLNLSAFGVNAEALTLSVNSSELRKTSRDVNVIVANQPYLGFSGWTMNGRAAGGVHVGEVINLNATVENFGTVGTTGGRVTITGMTGPAAITRAEAAVPGLGSRERQPVGSGLSFTVNSDARRGDRVTVNFTWETEEGQIGQFSLSWPVVRAELEVTAVDYGDSSIEGIGAEGSLFVTVKNIGSEVLKSASISAIPAACTSASEGLLSVPELAPGASARIATPFHIVTNSSCESGSIGQLAIAGEYQSVARRLSLTGSAKYLVGVLEVDTQRFDALAMPIPDNAEGVNKVISVGGSGPIKDVSVYVKVTHTFVGDLSVTLTTPSGKVISLQERVGGSQDNLDQRYGLGGLELSELQALAGTESQGNWTISVHDRAATDTGTLDALELSIRHW